MRKLFAARTLPLSAPPAYLFRGPRMAAIVMSALLALCAAALGTGRAHAQSGDGRATSAQAPMSDRAVERRLERQRRRAMEQYDGFEFEDAHSILERALNWARDNQRQRHPYLARIYIDLAIVHASGLDQADKAERALWLAVGLNRAIEIDAAYRSRELDTWLSAIKERYANADAYEAKVRTAANGGADAADPADPADPADSDDLSGYTCTAVADMLHRPPKQAEAGTALAIETLVNDKLAADTVLVSYRVLTNAGPNANGGASGASAPAAAGVPYRDVVLNKGSACAFDSQLQLDTADGATLEYYLTVLDRERRTLAVRGSPQAPYAVAVTPSAAALANAVALGSQASARGAKAPPMGPGIYLAIAGGSGTGYMRGKTEQVDSDIDCCVAPEPAYVRVEAGYRISERTSMGLQMRLGFPIGANLDEHAVVAPAVLVRLRRGLRSVSEGFTFWGMLGGGVSRVTVHLQGADSDQDTDTAATGPLLLGTGMGYAVSLSEGRLRLTTELDLLVGVPVADEIDTTRTGLGLVAGLSLGLWVDL